MIFKPTFNSDRFGKGGIEYRLYFLGDDGHIRKSYEFEAESDEAAIEIAESRREARHAELWQNGRLVKSLG